MPVYDTPVVIDGLDALTPQDRRAVACQHILAAFNNEDPVYIRRTWAAFAINAVVSKLRSVKWLVLAALIALSFYERPAWCIRAYETTGVADYPCDRREYQGFRQPFLPLWTSFAFEAVMLTILLLLESGETYAGGIGYFRPERNWFKWPLLIAAILDMIIAMITPAHVVRFGPFLRIAMGANYSPDIRQQFKLLIRIIPGLVPLLVLTVLFLEFFAFFGLVLFHEIEESAPYFKTFGRATWQLLVLLTSSNFPDVMLGAYNLNRVSVFFFLAFILLGSFFLINLFTAVVYGQYMENEEEAESQALDMTQRHLKRAFALLDINGNGNLSRDEIMATVSELRKAHLLPDVGEATGHLLFAALDRTGNDQISEQEFMELATVLQVQWEEEDRETYLQRFHPKLFCSKWFQGLRSLVLSPAFQHSCDTILLLMCVSTIWETASTLNRPTDPNARYKDGKIDTIWNVAEVFFTVFFVVEALLKIAVYGWKLYWRDHMNRLEFFTAISSAVVAAVVYIPNNFDDTRYIRWTIMLRLLRFFRFLRLARLPSMLRFLCMFLSVQHVRIFYETFITMMPNAMRLIKMMFCILFFYAALGVQLFGGLVSTDPASPQYHKLKGMAYGQSGYWALNLNDIPSGLVLMVQLLVVNNWMVFTEAFVAVGGTIAWFYFISFYFVGVLAGLNILVSFVLDAFMTELKEDELEEAERDGQVSGEGHAFLNPHTMVINASTVTGTTTGLEGKYRVCLKGYKSTTKKAEMLLKLFQQPNRADVQGGPAPGSRWNNVNPANVVATNLERRSLTANSNTISTPLLASPRDRSAASSP